MSTGSFMQIEEECTPTMCARDYKDPPVVCYSLDRASFNQGKNAQFDIGIDDGGGAHTLVAKGPNAVCYGICSTASNAMKSNNPNSGVYETDSSKTLDTSGINPTCNQGGILIVQNEPMGGVLTPYLSTITHKTEE